MTGSGAVTLRSRYVGKVPILLQKSVETGQEA
jgi:hypothetical protein